MEIPKTLPKEIANKYSVLNNTFRLVDVKNKELDKYNKAPKDLIVSEVGDVKQDNFYPQLKLGRWGNTENDNEVNFSIRLIDNEKGKEKVETIGDKIKWSKGNKEIEFYDYKDGYKLVWFLKKKPKTNKVEFTIQSKGLDFFYQPSLNQEKLEKGQTADETHIYDKDGKIVAERPIEVVNSYAVYHNTKGGAVDKDGKDYKVGKAFHIYRPHLIDTKGNEAWGILKIENGIYSVEIPQEFLDKAVYPIKSNDTFGYTSAGGSNLTPGDDMICGYKFTLSEDATVSSMSLYSCVEATGWTTVDVTMGIYDTSWNREGKTDEYIIPSSDGTINWESADIASGGNLSADDYHLCFNDKTNGSKNIKVSYDTGETDYSFFETSVNYATEPIPDPLPGSSPTVTGEYKFSIYATYTASSTFTPKAIWF